MSDLRKAAQALVNQWESNTAYPFGSLVDALRAALAQPEQEPVAVVAMDISGLHMYYGGEYMGQRPDTKIAMLFKDLPVGTRLFSAPPQRKPLTDDRIDMLLNNERLRWVSSPPTYEFASAFARSIEKAHGIGVE